MVLLTTFIYLWVKKKGKFVKMNTTYGFKWKKIEGENKDE